MKIKKKRIQFENHDNPQNLEILLGNHKSYENHTTQCENNENLKTNT